MASSLATYLFQDASSRALRVLSEASKPKGVREIADLCALSPRGASIVLNRLQKQKLVNSVKVGKHPKYRANLNREDRELLRKIIEMAQRSENQRQGEVRSQQTQQVLGWIDGTLKMLKKTSEKYRGTVRTS